MNKAPKTDRWAILQRAVSALSRKQRPVDGDRRDRPPLHESFRHLLGWLSYVAATFVLDWFATRAPMHFVQAVPALVLVLGAVAITAQRAPSHEELTERNGRFARLAEEDKDLDAADTRYRRRAVLQDFDRAVVYKRAVLAEDKGDLVKAKELMEQIAPREAAGYADAHLWLAKHLVSEKKGSLSRDEAETYRDHLNRVVEREPDNTEGRAMLGMFHFAYRRYLEAADHLAYAAPDYPNLLLRLARAYASSGRGSEARDAAEQSIEHYERAIAEDPSQHGYRFALSLSYAFLERFSEAESVLKEARNEIKAAVSDTGETIDARTDKQADEDRVCQALSNLLVARFTHSWRADDRDRSELLELAKRALRYKPDNLSVLPQLAHLAAEDDDTAREAKSILDGWLGNEKTPAETYFILGTTALGKGDYALAVEYLEQANEKRPNSAKILNNLAWAIAYKDSPDLKRALSLCEEALKLKPLNRQITHQVRETHGQILAKLGRYREALVELEYALPGLNDNSGTHATLAEVYEALGEHDLAELHRRIPKADE